MEETINTRKTWGWKIAAYLFLVGVGTGAYLAGFLFNLFYPDLVILADAGAVLGVPLVAIGILFLIWDLGKKSLAFLAFSRPGVSWISRGIIIITIFIVFALLYIAMGIWPFTWLEEAPGLRIVLRSIAAVSALCTLFYTGMALGAVRSIAFWDPIFLPGLFLISGISTGIMVLAFYGSVYGLSAGANFAPVLVSLASYDAFVITVEVITIGIFLVKTYYTVPVRVSTRMLLVGRLVVHFWLGVVVMGLVVPFSFEFYIAYLSLLSPVAMLVLRTLVCLVGLSGGFLMRYVILTGGSSLPLDVNGVRVPLPAIPRIKAFR